MYEIRYRKIIINILVLQIILISYLINEIFKSLSLHTIQASFFFLDDCFLTILRLSVRQTQCLLKYFFKVIICISRQERKRNKIIQCKTRKVQSYSVALEKENKWRSCCNEYLAFFPIWFKYIPRTFIGLLCKKMQRSRGTWPGLCNCKCKLNEIKQLIKVPDAPGEVNWDSWEICRAECLNLVP